MFQFFKRYEVGIYDQSDRKNNIKFCPAIIDKTNDRKRTSHSCLEILEIASTLIFLR